MLQFFRSEPINRIDEIVQFHQLTKTDVRKILDIHIHSISKKLDAQNITLKISDEAKDFLVEKGFDKEFGARPLARAIQNELLDELAMKLIDGSFDNSNYNKNESENKTIHIDVNENKEALEIQ